MGSQGSMPGSPQKSTDNSISLDQTTISSESDRLLNIKNQEFLEMFKQNHKFFTNRSDSFGLALTSKMYIDPTLIQSTDEIMTYKDFWKDYKARSAPAKKAMLITDNAVAANIYSKNKEDVINQIASARTVNEKMVSDLIRDYEILNQLYSENEALKKKYNELVEKIQI